MKEREQAGIRLSVRTDPAWEHSLRQAAAGLILLTGFAAGLLGVVCQSAGLHPGLGFAAALAVFVLCCGGGLWLAARRKLHWTATALLVLAGACLLLAQPLRQGAYPLLNGLQARSQTVQGTIHLLFPAGSGQLPAAAAGAALLGLLSALAYVLFPWAALLPLLAGWVLTACGYTELSGWLILMSISCVLLLMTALRRHYFGQKSRAFAQTALICLVVLAVLGGAFSAAGTAARYPAEGLRRSIVHGVHTLRFGSGADALPEGDFRALDGRPSQKTPMLSVELSAPAAMWLRGFVGETYTPQGWQPLSGAERAGDAERFYWLHRDGFFGQSQLETAARLLEPELTAETATVTVQGACREYLLIPYGLTADSGIPDADGIGDDAVRSGAYSGAKTYTYRFVPGLEAQAYELLSLLEEQLENPEMAEYFRQETEYRDYVYRHCLELPEATRQTLAEFLGAAPEAITSYEAKETIRSKLGQAVRYDDTAGLAEGDPVTVFLKQQGGGWAAQYATAAVMMLRYYGIPARYVEGFLIPEAAAAQTVELTGSDAHIWAEYYEDGLGWIPFEVTPPYLGLMPESEWQWFEQQPDAELESSASESGVLGNAASQSLRPTTSRTEVEQQTSQQITQQIQGQQNQIRPNLPKHSLLWLLIVLLLALLGVLAWIVLHRCRVLNTRRALMESEDGAVAISAMFAHSMCLMWHSGLERSNGPLASDPAPVQAWLGEDNDDYAAMLRLNDEAMFSSHSFDSGQRTRMAEFLSGVQQRYRGRLKPLQRLYQKWILCMD